MFILPDWLRMFISLLKPRVHYVQWYEKSLPKACSSQSEEIRIDDVGTSEFFQTGTTNLQLKPTLLSGVNAHQGFALGLIKLWT